MSDRTDIKNRMSHGGNRAQGKFRLRVNQPPPAVLLACLVLSCLVLLACLLPSSPAWAGPAGARDLGANQPIWNDVSIPGIASAIREIQVEPGAPDRVCAIADGADDLYYSQDGGSSWTPYASTTGAPFVSLCRSKAVAGDFFALDSSGRVYAGTDHGTTWAQVSVLPVPASDLDSGAEAIDLLAASGVGVTPAPIYYSYDTASHWNASDSDPSCWSLAAGDPSASDVFYAAREETSDAPVCRSADGGASWSASGTLPAASHPSAMLVLPTGGPVLLGTDTPGVAPLYRSNDGGASWVSSSSGISITELVSNLTEAPGRPAALATTDKNVYASYDNGTTWADISGLLPEKEFTAVAASGGTAGATYAGAADGKIYTERGPVLAELDPDSGQSGSSVTVHGSNFGAGDPASYVSFAGIPVTQYDSWTDSEISLHAPREASTGEVFVVTPWGTSNSMTFTVTVPPPPAFTWYLAEGSTGEDAQGSFETWVLMQNPGDSSADVILTYMTDHGVKAGPRLTVPPASRKSINVADTVPGTWSVSTFVQSDKAIIVERSVYWNAEGSFRQAATGSIGVTAPADEWFLAEGCTGIDSSGTFETWVLVQNPGDTVADVNLTFMTPNGPETGPGFQLLSGTRRSVNVADYLPNCWSVSTKVTSDQPVVAERSMYFNSAAAYRQAATDSIGVTSGKTGWYLAEGCTGAGQDGAFETWILVQNPGMTPANAQLTYMTTEGPVEGPLLSLAPESRQSVNVADTVPNCWAVSTRIDADGSVIAERSIYWSTPECLKRAATDSIGVATAATSWCLAEGCTGANEDGAFETWVLVQNPNQYSATARLTFMTPQGEVDGPVVPLAPNSRSTVNVAETVPGDWDVSTRVTSDHPVIVERAMYWDAPDAKRQAATDSIGVSR